MQIGVPYQDALHMPLDMANALLSPIDERQQNTRRVDSPSPSSTPVKKRSGTTYIATKFKNSKGVS